MYGGITFIVNLKEKILNYTNNIGNRLKLKEGTRNLFFENWKIIHHLN